MKIVAFKINVYDEPRPGAILTDGKIADLTDISDKSAKFTLNEFYDFDTGLHKLAETELEKVPKFSRDAVRLCAPVPNPKKIICIGLNYRNHAIESGMKIPESPIIFSKFSSCAIGSGEPILIPKGSTQTDYEAELAFVIGKTAKNVSRDEAMDYVFGYTNFNDVSARDFQFADGQWHRGKSCDSFAPIGEYVASKDEIADPHNLRIRFKLNGETLQDSNTNELIFGIAELIEFLSRYITLEPGDVIATGTPPGVGFARKPAVYLKDGDVCEVEIEGLGTLRNPVKQL
ncbi:MAG: fumarylacetoacetate hydrolase family protein [Pyrinomonadaceae bacterium]